MEKNQFDLCCEVLKRFDRAGILDDMVFIGSWCVYFYQDYFSNVPYINQLALKTRDIDVLIPSPRKIRSSMDLPSLVQDLGYIVSFDQHTGQMRLDHPALIMEFLVPKIGIGSDKPQNIDMLGINAFPIRYTNILEQEIINVEIEGIKLRIPHPVSFAFQKLLICSRRIILEKGQKDRNTAIKILHLVIQKGEVGKMIELFNRLGTKQRRLIVRELKREDEDDIIKILLST
ncbi:GSU2403 family nucleotidyltransferase fold protein [Candidatus Latescibacterota bacterium]